MPPAIIALLSSFFVITNHKQSGIPMSNPHNDAFISDIIRMAWADDVSFDKIKRDRGLSEAEVIKIMRRHLKPSSFRLWRKRVSGRGTKHEKRRTLLRQEVE
jgi:uncharacterized protein (TIGR03643 family)